jgi:hypothetical protein
MPLLTTTLAGLAGALSLAAGSPFASASSPVSIVSCDYSSVQSSAALTPETAPYAVRSLQISFVNQSAVTATGVKIAVRYADRTQILDDAGTFATGTPITRNFVPTGGGLYDGSSAQCTVEAVTFADGSVWQAS